ncbi:MAG TPA: hypothetical protein V6C89_21055 [Drouetiella sp.]|jgi:hypothetical protein
MRPLEQLTAENILSVKLPESLFSRSPGEAKHEYRILARRWHPDHQNEPEAVRVFVHIVELYGLARKKLAAGDWDTSCEKIEDQKPGLHRFRLTDNSVKTCRYRACRTFELGKVYISDNSITYEIDNEFKELFEQGRKRIRMLCFRGDAMALEMSKYLPQIKHEFKTSTSSILVIRKTPDQLLLRDVIKHFNGRVAPISHTGWILNNLLNMACYLDWAGLSHNAITSTTVFISPLRHTAMLLGGWWYATKSEQPLSFLPEEALPSIPPDVLRNKRTDPRVDLELIKTIGRELLGDPSGAHLALDKSLPPDLVHWLQLPSSGNPVEEYKTFKRDILVGAFGSPKFVDMRLDANELYKEY